MFRVWKKNLGRVGKSEAHVYFLALTYSDAEQLGTPFLLKGNFIMNNSQIIYTIYHVRTEVHSNNFKIITKKFFYK